MFIDLARQAKFSYALTATPGYADQDVLNEIYDHFGVIVTQDTSNVTVSLPTTGLTTTSLKYLRQITSHNDSTENLTITLETGVTVVLNPGQTIYVFWTGAQWMAYPSERETSRSVQGSIYSAGADVVIWKGEDFPTYLDKITFNLLDGSGTLGTMDIHINGVTVLAAPVNITGSAETVITISPRATIGAGELVLLDPTSNSQSFKNYHYKADIYDTPS